MSNWWNAGRWLATVCAVAGFVFAPVAELRAQPVKPVKRPPVQSLDKDGGLEYLVNPRPGFLVTLKVDREDRTYFAGDTLTATVTSEKDGFAYVFFKNANGEWKTFYPNLTNTDNAIKANTPLVVPGKDVLIRIGGPPFGLEKLKVVVTTKQIPLPEAENLFKKRPAMSPLAAKTDTARFVYSAVSAKNPPVVQPGRDAWNEYQNTVPKPNQNPNQNPVQVVVNGNLENARDWAEDSVEIMTKEKGGKPEPFPPAPLPDPKPKPEPKPEPPAKFGRRVGVFIGVNEYDQKATRPISNLQVADKDAKRMAAVAQEQFRLDEVLVLTNAEATKKNIEEALGNAALAAPSPNDFVMIYWSGHGGQCSNVVAGGGGALRQYLVPHDGDLLKENESMVLDTTFAEWVKKLQGRKVLVVLDTCHAGGLVANPQKAIKGRPPQQKILALKSTWPKHYMESQVKFLKQINQQDVVVLAATEPTEPALEGKEDLNLSVYTYYLIEKIEAAKGQVSPEELHEYAKVKVPEYVQKQFMNLTQHPTRGGQITPAPYILRPKP